MTQPAMFSSEKCRLLVTKFFKFEKNRSTTALEAGIFSTRVY